LTAGEKVIQLKAFVRHQHFYLPFPCGNELGEIICAKVNLGVDHDLGDIILESQSIVTERI
jgi:hypothetical protein